MPCPTAVTRACTRRRRDHFRRLCRRRRHHHRRRLCTRSRSRGRPSPDAPQQLLPKRFQAGLKGIRGRGRPVGALGPRDGVGAREGDVQHVQVAVPVVARHGVAEAKRRQGDGGFADHGLGGVVAVFIAPYAEDLSGVQGFLA